MLDLIRTSSLKNIVLLLVIITVAVVTIVSISPEAAEAFTSENCYIAASYGWNSSWANIQCYIDIAFELFYIHLNDW